MGNSTVVDRSIGAVVEISARTVLRGRLALVGVFVATHLAAWVVLDVLEPTWTLRIFDVGEEMSIPTWVSQMLLMAGAVVALLTFQVERAGGARSGPWLAIGALLAYASMDEGAAIHELAIEPVRGRLGSAGGLLHFAWVVPFGILVLIIAGALFHFWLGLPERTRRLTAASAVVYVSGAVVLEMAGAPMAADERITSVPYLLTMTAEEATEMVGSSLFLYAVLDFLGRREDDDLLGLAVRP